MALPSNGEMMKAPLNSDAAHPDGRNLAMTNFLPAFDTNLTIGAPAPLGIVL
jgi:hypothetical protein